MSCLEIEELQVKFDTASGTVYAVDTVTIKHKTQTTLALVGETGCGKSVIAHSILNLLPTNAQISGYIHFQGYDLLTLDEKTLSDIRGKEISLVMQNATLSLNPVYNIGSQINESYFLHTQISRDEVKNNTFDLLGKMGFENPKRVMSLYPFQLSEGMNQRVLIANAMALNPLVIIADEPTKGLDEQLKAEIVRELGLIKENEKTSLFLITHDLMVAQEISDYIAIMYCGEIMEMAEAKEFFTKPLHPYSQGLINSLPEHGLKPIPGFSPSMISRPQGCRFHPRCQSKMERCELEKPELIQVNEREVRCFLYG